MKILLDEMYTGLKPYLESLGYETYTVEDRDLQGKDDTIVAKHVLDNDMILVTENELPAQLTELLKGKSIQVRQKDKANLIKSIIEEKYFPTESTLICEYEVLNNNVLGRGQNNLIVDTIFFAASFGLLAWVFQLGGSSQISSFTFLSIKGTVFILSIAPILIFLTILQRWTSSKIDDVYFDRIHEIEKILSMKGHKDILDELQHSRRYKLRSKYWSIAYFIPIGFYLIIMFLIQSGNISL